MPGANERVDRALERREGAALDVLEEVLLVHLHEVGCVVRRKLGRQLVPVPTPFRRLRCDGRARVNAARASSVVAVRWALPHHTARMAVPSCDELPGRLGPHPASAARAGTAAEASRRLRRDTEVENEGMRSLTDSATEDAATGVPSTVEGT